MPSTEIYTLSLHDALPISAHRLLGKLPAELRSDPDAKALEEMCDCTHIDIVHLINRPGAYSSSSKDYEFSRATMRWRWNAGLEDRKSTRLNSSHSSISYAVHRDLHSFPTRRSSDLGASPAGQAPGRAQERSRRKSPRGNVRLHSHRHRAPDQPARRVFLLVEGLRVLARDHALALERGPGRRAPLGRAPRLAEEIAVCRRHPRIRPHRRRRTRRSGS